MEPRALAALKTRAAARGYVILAHGAGGDKDTPHLLDLAGLLQDAGLSVHRFNFPYREAGRSVPDPLPKLMAAYRAEVEAIRKKNPALLIFAGHSMGGRVGSHLAAEGDACDGLLLFSYPLHPPGHPEKLRDAHLGNIRVPVLSVNGTRDNFIEKPLMEKVLKKVKAPWTQHWIEEADHGLKVPKRTGKTRADTLKEIAAALETWLAGLSGKK